MERLDHPAFEPDPSRTKIQSASGDREKSAWSVPQSTIRRRFFAFVVAGVVGIAAATALGTYFDPMIASAPDPTWAHPDHPQQCLPPTVRPLRIASCEPAPPQVATPAARVQALAPSPRKGAKASQAADRLLGEIHVRAAELREPWEAALLRGPDAQSRFDVRMAIDARGRVLRVDLLGDHLADPAFSGRLRELLRRWRFTPPAAGPLEVTWPLEFEPAHETNGPSLLCS